MTRHVAKPGTPEDMGHLYYVDQDGMLDDYPLEPAWVLEVLNAMMGRDGTASELPRSEPVTQMPEGFTMDARGNLFMATAKDGKILVLALGNVDFAGNATILAAVTAWCDAMKARP